METWDPAAGAERLSGIGGLRGGKWGKGDYPEHDEVSRGGSEKAVLAGWGRGAG